MVTQSVVAALELPFTQQRRWSQILTDYWALTKPEINLLIAITTAAGFWLASPATLSSSSFICLENAVLGTALVASGAAALNQVIELRFDAKMRRTMRRPAASGRILCGHAFLFGMALSILGIVYLELLTNGFAALLAAFTLLSYLFLYTPLKRKTPLCTLIGAVPGAMPPLIGWVAASGSLDARAWGLFAIVFLWQFPHFMAIAWMFREDYVRAGYLVLPDGCARSSFVAWHTLLPALALLPISLIPAISGDVGHVYQVAAVVLGLVLLGYAIAFIVRGSNAAARQLLFASIAYLPALFAFVMLDKK